MTAKTTRSKRAQCRDRAPLALRASRMVPLRLKRELRRVPLVRWVADRVYSRVGLTLFPLDVGGLRIEIDMRNPVERAFVVGRHESYVLDWLRQTVRPGWVCLDVGAFIGWHTVHLAAFVGPRGEVVAFEPVPDARDRLRRNVLLNGLDNVRVEGVALSDQAGEAAMWVEQVGGDAVGGKSSLVRRSFRGYEVRVRVDTLDAWVSRAGLGRVNLLKLDVEGLELEVLAGAMTVLRRFRPIVLVEFNDEETRTRGRAILRDLGYQVEELGRAPSMVHDVAHPSAP